MLGATFSRRPVWVSVLMGAGFGAAGQLLITGGLMAGAGWRGPVVLGEAARIAALAAGARRVIVTMSDGFHVEAIFGEAVGPDEDLSRPVRDVD